MNTTVINMNNLHLNSVRLNGIGKVQSVSLSAGESTEEPIYPPVEPPVEPTPTFTLSASVINGQVSATKNGAAISLPYVANEGDVIVLSVAPSDGYEFNGWADGVKDNPRTITMASDVVLSAECSEVVAPPVGNYIQFEDKAVEAICVANWSSDGIGLTEKDAAAVTTIGNAFYGNETIEYFNEFEYFTGITHLVNPNASATIKESFYGCKNLKEIRLPSSLTTIYDGSDSYKNGAFYGCSSLVSVGDMSHITRIGRMAFRDCSSFSQEINAPSVEGSIGYYAFYGTAIKKVSNLGNATILVGVSSASINSPVGAFARCTSLEEVRLPATTEQVQKGSFGFCTVLKTIVCEATTPPSLDANAWYGSNALTAIYVPDASLEAYKTAVNWSAYADRIHPLSEIEGSLVFYDKLVGDGTAYINTEYYPKGTDTFDYDVTPKTTNAKFVWGVKSNSISLGEFLYTKDSSYFLYGPTAARDIGMANVGRLQRQLRVTLSDNGQYFRVISAGDTSVNLAQGTGSYFSATAENPLLLFACQQTAGTGSFPDSRRSDGALWSFKITDIDGNTIMSLKPCTFVGEAGMWDEVNGKFYGNAASSGEFSVAND